MGVSGGNFLVAETGSVAVFTNEGNEGMCTVLPPKVHVVVTGIEKVLPTLEDLATVARLLPRSATGQSISNYFSILTGPRAPGEQDGPEHMYFVLVDGGRTGLLGGEFQDMLRCIRCGACMNHCPVYQKIGGHTYGWVYPGPMGSVLTPSYVGVEKALDLPQAATLCGECHVVCPMKIPLPDLLRKLRERQFDRGLRPWTERLGLKAWAFVAKRPALYRPLARMGAWVLGRLGGEDGRVRSLPLAGGWTASRDMPTPRGPTFKQRWARQRH
jgi:L-lactate dehydrogenase complex protein LldF